MFRPTLKCENTTYRFHMNSIISKIADSSLQAALYEHFLEITLD